jgi:hypothetical protein
MATTNQNVSKKEPAFNRAVSNCIYYPPPYLCAITIELSMISYHHHATFLSYFLLLLAPCLQCNVKAKRISCTDASENLYDKSNSLEVAYENIEDYVNKNCNSTTVNDFCYWSYLTIDENIWSLSLKYNGTVELSNLTQAYKNACLKAGGKVVEVTFHIVMTGIDPWYFNQTGAVSQYSVFGSPECVSASACKNASDIEEYIRYGWGTYYGATVKSITIYQLHWDNYSYLF